MLPYTFSSMTHNYRAGLFDCCQDSRLCCRALFCYPCTRAQAWADVRNQRKTCCHIFSHGIFIRSNVRMARGIQQDFASDCCIYLFCPCCALVQDVREIRYLKEEILESVEKGEPFVHYILTDNKQLNDYRTESAFIPNVVVSAEKSSKEKKDYFADTNTAPCLPHLRAARTQKIIPVYSPLDDDQIYAQLPVPNLPTEPPDTNEVTSHHQNAQVPIRKIPKPPPANDLLNQEDDNDKESIVLDASPIKSHHVTNPSPMQTPTFNKRRHTIQNLPKPNTNENTNENTTPQLNSVVRNENENLDETSVEIDETTQSSLINTSDFQSPVKPPSRAAKILHDLNSTTPQTKRTSAVNLTFSSSVNLVSPSPPPPAAKSPRFNRLLQNADLNQNANNQNNMK